MDGKAHKDSIITVGPRTNIAPATRLSPGFASTVNELVFMGKFINDHLPTVIENTSFTMDFNMMMDSGHNTRHGLRPCSYLPPEQPENRQTIK